MMSKYLLYFILISFLFASCNKTYPKKVTYIATASVSAYNLQYLSDQNVLVKTLVEPQSAQDIWKYEFMSEEGEIVYINGNYKDINSALKIQVLVDGKVYKQGATEGDTLKYLVVSGVVPYD
jgi:hypothetical protein